MIKRYILTAILFFTFIFSKAQNVGIGTTSPLSKLHVNGSLQVNADYISSTTAPTPAQTTTMASGGTLEMPQTDSVARVYDPGGPAGNYLPSSNAIFDIVQSSGDVIFELLIENIQLGTGDSLIVYDSPVPDARVLFRDGNGFSGTNIRITIPYHECRILFKSNADASTGSGYSILITKKYLNTTATDPPVATGNALIFYPIKGALRSGYLRGGTIGEFGSIGLGYYSEATGISSVAIGSGNDATGDVSTAIGYGNKAQATGAMAFGTGGISSGEFSLTTGYLSQATAESSTALGKETKATNVGATSMGQGTTASGAFSTAMGDATFARGHRSTAMGNSSEANGENAIAMGNNSIASGFSSIAIGLSTRASFNASVAMGSNTTASANYAMAAGFNTTASGQSSTALGNFSIASGLQSTAIGLHAKARGEVSVALGNFTEANGQYATAMGYYSKAIGDQSMAFGNATEAHELGSVSMGLGTRTTGVGAVGMGQDVVARPYSSLAIGVFNDSAISASPYTWEPADPVFIIGNGTANNARRNAFTVFKNGNTDINGYLRIGRAVGASADNSGIITGWGVSGRQADAGKIQYGGFGTTHTLNLVGGGTNATGADRVVKVWSEGGMRVRGNALPDGDNIYSLGQSGTRWTAVWAANGVIQTSDARLKTNISSINYGLKELMQMNPVQYNWKTNPSDKKEIGFLAQEIQTIIPEAVEVPANGDAMGMKYTELIPVLVKAMQEQQQQINNQQKEIEELKKLLKQTQK